MALDAGDWGIHIADNDMSHQNIALKELQPKDRLVVALDAPTVAKARAMVKSLNNEAGVYKIGLELLFGGGLSFAHELKEEGKRVFLDMKLHDIGNTVEKSVANVACHGFDFLTVHGTNRKILDAAVRGRGNSKLKLLAVTVQTDLDASDLVDEGITGLSPLELVVRRATMAQDAGFDGVIASGHEARAIRAATNAEFIIKVPGIRPEGAQVNDQKRTMTPAQAIAAGATYLVVGRPIFSATDPAVTAAQIVKEIEAAVKRRQR